MITNKDKNPEGRPKVFQDKELLKEKINKFREFYKQKGNEEIPKTFERLACFLEVTTQTIRNYEKNDKEFKDIFSEIKQEIIAETTENLMKKGSSTAGIIFYLTNSAPSEFTNKHQEQQQPIIINANNPLLKEEDGR